jgi:hypothetical protein
MKDAIISVFDIHGQLAVQQCLINLKTEIDIKNLKAGVYLLKVSNAENTITQKVIKE